jgi:hypothetical protein
MTSSRGRRVSLVVSVIATLTLAGGAWRLSHGKRKPKLKDASTLPHVDRLMPVVTSDIPLREGGGLDAVLENLQAGLLRDPTEAGTLKVAYAGDQNSPHANVTLVSGNVDETVRGYIQNDYPILELHGQPLTAVLKLSSSMQHEPLAPGADAADNVVRKKLEQAPLRVRSTHLQAPYWDSFVRGERDRAGTLVVEVEFTETGVYEMCGEVSDFTPDDEGGRPPCPKVRHLKSDIVTITGTIDFRLKGDAGWEDAFDRHWFGDELREIEPSFPFSLF